MGNYNFDLNLEEKNTMSIINGWIEEGTKVLEFGPANGRLTRHLSQKKNCNVTIVEIDEVDGREAEKYAQNALIGREKGDINKFFWCDLEEQFDYIIFADVLEHLPNPGEVLNRCKEKLKPNGSILISIPNLSHNSVLIELLNDKFFYQKTGLLDSTHIHFFTYYSFLKMIDEQGFSVEDMDFVYSRVGWNEINNNYKDIPVDLERIIRERKFGSVYQFVAKIQNPNGTKSKNEFNNTEQYIDYLENEITCFCWNDISKPEEYSKKSFQYKEDGSLLKFCFEISSDVKKLRIDPMEERCILKVEEIAYVYKNGQRIKTTVSDSNASMYGENVFFFETKDPWLEVEIPENNSGWEVELVFRVLGSRMDNCFVEMCESLKSTKIGVDRKTKDRLLVLEKQQAKEKEYISHLENERAELKEYSNHLENERAELKEYSKSLEENCLEYKAYTERLEKEQLEYKTYIERLENDQKEFKSYIQRLEKEKETKDNEIVSLQTNLLELSNSKESLEEILNKKKSLFGKKRGKYD